ncbi:MAG: SiaC family regulatory phosphoprotein [Spirochaetia bacterium]|nr:SiaC family regulatory phosphoprotein [Spirochaetia bacterium]
MLEKEYQSSDLSLRLEVNEDGENIKLNFLGKSNARSPSDFLNPVLQEICDKAFAEKKKIVLDFCNLEYMNSSTVAPIIKLWAQLKSQEISLTVEYNNEILWQRANFSAFSIFEKESSLFNLRPR